MFARLQLNRKLIRNLLRQMQFLGQMPSKQATLGSTICASRFKYLDSTGLMPSVRQKCSEAASSEHLPQGAATVPVRGGGDACVKYLLRLGFRAATANSNYPAPSRESAAHGVMIA